jgi:hypothetical protein
MGKKPKGRKGKDLELAKEMGKDIQFLSETKNSTAILVPPEKFQEAIQGLRESATIRNDSGEEVSFDGEAKERFIDLCERAYPAVHSMMHALYETGEVLALARHVLKPHKLFLTWIQFTGIPERTAYNYMRVYDKFGDNLALVSHLGIKKLLTASRIPNCAKYVQENEATIAKNTVEELEKEIRRLKAKLAKKAGGRKPLYIGIAGCKIRPSTDGTRITIEGLTKKQQGQILEGIKRLLLQDKG